MRTKNVIFASLVLLFGLGLTGCSSSSQQPAQDHVHHEEGQPHQHEGGDTTSPNNTQVEKAIKDEIQGLATIESNVNKNDFQSASTLFDQIHEEYHSAILPSVKAKNAKLAEDMHGKFDALEDAIKNKDKTKTLNMIKINRDNLNQAAKELGISLKQ
ncbi:hypothetical protein [Aneurinibacillus thermoaerophilus]|uniref:Lipoprotein n=1 Tax=Aneurinibacillus thermoaerophilus TaxID=143495 RepID=A0A1G7Z7C0_ANETH|nr:hypothetical protein [Aneurinibacillus thermoaerophilus]MED0735787.1 hypothetical protein [Aneurinibacillus thermoaerophilus]MED0757995.1 hypothetical protein [Aneurinibacillus thermoaerophilus]MED0760176.1 hypothetical protein [Aneurinibacillus thermoaerophilus]SDH04010.1 hypothetical protein SAMN04489735_100951 [Aneurinibacillus thermoaerophilus]